MLPIKDLNRPLRAPHVNRILLIVNIVIFAVYWFSDNGIFLSPRIAEVIAEAFVMVPQEVLHGQRLYTLITSMFMHASWLHLFGNMLFLYIFGDNIEDIFGHGSYLLFYIFSGLAAAFTHILSILFAPMLSELLGIPFFASLEDGVVGASGAISGVLGAYLVLYPKAKILTLVTYFILPIPAIIFLGVWFLLQWLYMLFDVSGGVAYWAHIGGFVMGIILALAFGLGKKKARKAYLR
ncbi:MAG: rhomboid family intramembrane serine protease [Candidatus Bathyarchaeales archaeon]